VERLALLGQADADLPLVLGAAGAPHQARRLQALQQRGQGAALQEQLVAEAAHRLAVLGPERDHDQVLRVGEAQRVEHGLVRPDGRLGGGVQGEAEEVVEVEGGLGHGARSGFGRPDM
jgi:hypothetical protein